MPGEKTASWSSWMLLKRRFCSLVRIVLESKSILQLFNCVFAGVFGTGFTEGTFVDSTGWDFFSTVGLIWHTWVWRLISTGSLVEFWSEIRPFASGVTMSHFTQSGMSLGTVVRGSTATASLVRNCSGTSNWISSPGRMHVWRTALKAAVVAFRRDLIFGS